MIERLKYVMVMLLLIVLGRGVAFAQFNPTNPPDPDMPVVYRNISVSATPNGAANVSGAGKYAEGKSVSIRTSANTSYKFQYWTKNGEKYSESTSFNYTVGKEDVNFVAVYKFDPANPQDPETDKRYELYLSSSPEGCCSFNRTSGEKIEAGQSVYVNVYSNQGFQFLGWYNGETLVSSSKSFYYTMPEKKTTLVAKFVYNPTLPEDPSNDGDQSDIDPGTPGAVTGISLDKTLLYLPVGDSYTLNATVSPDDATDKTVTWSTSDASVATVANGVVKGIKEGKAVITAKAGSKTVTCDVHVIIPVTSVTLDKSSYDLSLGETFTLTASVLPDNATDKTVTWSSSNTSVAKVENGVVTSCGLGEAIITAKSGDKTASCNVRVIIPVSGVTLNLSTAEMLVGESLALNAEVAPSNATDKTVTWSTSDATIAAVDNNGVVKALKAGKVTITALAGGISATCTINIIVPVSGISLDKTSVELLEGETITLKATVSPDNATDKTVVWSTSDASIATVDNNGVVKAIKVGKVTITAKAGDKTSTCEVIVKPVPVSGIVLNKTSVELLEGESLTLTATVSPDNATDKTVTWSTSDATIATVDNNGVVKAIKVGKVTITAKAGDKTATCEVTVNPVPVSGIVLDKTTIELLEGETITLKATVSPDNATDKTVTWSTSDASIATVDNNGVVKAIKVGKVTITAKAGDKTATCDVTVKPVLVNGIVLNKTSVELLEGETITLKATVSPDNATDKTVTWSTSDASIATVDNNGVVKAIMVGKVTIIAKAGDKTATCEVTVNPVPVSGITLDKTSVELLEGETITLKATVSPDNATDKTVTWSTSDATIATVDNNGVVKAIKVGKVTITAKAGDKTATCEVTVNPVPVDGIVLDKAEVELLEGDSITLTATVSPDNATDKTVTWSTSDATIATVDNNGVVKAIKVGKVTITAKAGDKTATCEVTVKPNDVGIDDVNVTVNVLNGDIYTIRGIKVRNAGESLEGLAKGVYIKNGKKFLVK